MVFSVTLGAILTGHSVQTSVKTGMSMAQIGEFSFIIAGLGMVDRHGGDSAVRDRRGGFGRHDVVDSLVYPLGRAGGQVCRSQAAATAANLRGPVWLLDRAHASDTQNVVEISRTRRLVRWLAVDAVVVAAIVIGASIELKRSARSWRNNYSSPADLRPLPSWVARDAVSSPFWIGMIRTARFLGLELANRAFPQWARAGSTRPTLREDCWS